VAWKREEDGVAKGGRKTWEKEVERVGCLKRSTAGKTGRTLINPLRRAFTLVSHTYTKTERKG
jgi:hypothetical protein